MKFPHPLRPLLTLAVLATTGALALGEVKETFTTISEGALLTTLPGWSFSGENDQWTVTSEGLGGGAIEAASTGTYQRSLSDAEVIDSGSGPSTFRLKIRFVGSDSWADIRVNLLQSGGINGLSLSFNGGEQEGSGDNITRISEGGAYWGDIQYQKTEGQWRADTWYQVEINNLEFGSDGVTGTVTIYEAQNPSQKLVDNAPIGLFGKALDFKKIDLISISSVGAARTFQVSDIYLGPAKKS